MDVLPGGQPVVLRAGALHHRQRRAAVLRQLPRRAEPRAAVPRAHRADPLGLRGARRRRRERGARPLAAEGEEY